MSVNEEILIGEGVRLESGAAPVTMRMGSALIDVIIYGVFFAVTVGWVTEASSVLNEALFAAIVVAWVVLCLVVIPATVETLTRGRSAGRLALGLRIVRDDGGPVSGRHALGRALVGVLEIFATAGILAVTVSMLSARGKRIGDVVSGTFAMRTRGSQRALPPMVMPPMLREWGATADVRRLPDGLALTARIFLARAASMHVPTRQRLGVEFAEALLKYVSPPPPQGVHPEYLIAGVLCVRRDQEYALARRQASQQARDVQSVTSLPFGIEDHAN